MSSSGFLSGTSSPHPKVLILRVGQIASFTIFLLPNKICLLMHSALVQCQTSSATVVLFVVRPDGGATATF